MPDIPGNSSTTSVLTVGGVPVSDVLEINGDHDWFRIDLVAGQKVTITVNGLTLDDTYLRLRNSSGSQIAENDDISLGTVTDSRLVYTAPTTGTYYIDVGSYNDVGTGTYQVQVQTYTPPPVVDMPTFANFLTDGYWGGDRHHFDVTQGSISVNLSLLTAAGQTLARAALAQWSSIIGVNFAEVSSGGQITFDDGESGAFATATRSGGITSTAHVNVSTSWLADYGTTLTSYSYQTYIHEIGHALGLGHAGYYNSTGDYATEAVFSNDGWPVSVMSYFDQLDSTFYAEQSFNVNYITTPMMADIYAMSVLYGLSTTTRAGNDVYGAGWSNSMGALCLFDTGGIDAINVSSLSGSQVVNLTPGSFSNILGEAGNVSISLNTIIENATAGNGNDTLIGNTADNILDGGSGSDSLSGLAGNDTLIGGNGLDILTGGAGNDSFVGFSSDLSGDTITDFSAGDRIVLSDQNLFNFTFNISGSTLTFNGGSLTLTGGVSGTLVASVASGGGVQLAIQTVSVPVADVRNDFNGDGRSDILWRNIDGQLSNWLGQANGGFVQNNANAAAVVPTSWSIAGTGDFNGDGRDDILWRNVDGQLSNWLATASGGFVQNNANAAAVVPTAWSVAGTGDFNGDGRDDILWRNTNGTVSDWLGQANGGFIANDVNAARFVPTSWSVVGTGDFNGDGRDDILWRNSNGQLSDWLGQANGGFVLNDAIALTQVDTAWSVAGTGDFNGDGRDDILWRNSNGTISTWSGQANGGFVNNGAISGVFVPLAWSVVAVGDYNGDGRDDILWRNSNGTVTDWLANPNGSFTPNDAAAAQSVPTAWHVQPEAPFI